MSVAFRQETKDALVDMILNRPTSHCIGWLRATASLWGMTRDHDLDEPVQLSEEAPVRLRYVGRNIVADRGLTFKTTRAGTHVAIRFYFRDGGFHEVGIDNVNSVNSGETAYVKLQPRLEWS